MKKNFFFVGQIIPQYILDENFTDLSKIVDIAGNNFYKNILNGLEENDCNITIISQIPKKFLNKYGKNNYKNIEVIFVKFNEFFLFRYIKNIFIYFYYISQWQKDKDEKYVIFNVLRIGASIGGLIASKFFKLKTIGVVTDVPGYRVQLENSKSLKIKLSNYFGQMLLNKFDTYVLLSDNMKDILNVDKRCCVIEGIIDNIDLINKKEDKIKTNSFIILYAGSLHYRYGIMNLIQAVQMFNDNNIQLHIYGKGEAQQDIIEIEKNDQRICYKGIVPRNVILLEEQKASLLVNPRPIDEEYTKYSFPSKNIEYLASGTLTLLTNIPSLPDEYKKFIILAENNSPKELFLKISTVMNMSDNDYRKLGKKAREFVLSEKNKKIQTKKIIEMVDSI